jgi:hypothetical protein
VDTRAERYRLVRNAAKQGVSFRVQKLEVVDPEWFVNPFDGVVVCKHVTANWL